MPINSNPKVIVAVHGVGDQILSETVQTVINRFCRYHGKTMGVPLGKIKNISDQKNPYEQKNPSGQTSPDDYSCKPFKMSELNYDGELGKLSFVEIYWADLARKVDENRFLLENPKSWSKTIIERLPNNYQEAAKLSPKEFGRLRLLLSEMLETIKTLENLFKVADLAGIFKFDLAGVLNAYLGDVQIMAEFRDVRANILKRFKEVMKKLPRDADIYLVAHSEGTVVVLLSLLEEMSREKSEQPKWLTQIRGLMTIGSPLDKHLLLWPELFAPDGNPIKQWKPKNSSEDSDIKIEWRNYYDNGDPIGFELEGMRHWLRDNGWTAFNFSGTEDLTESEESKADKSSYDKCKDLVNEQVKEVKNILKPPTPIHDFGFTRYYFPGKAHNDYWGDSEVFGHFIQTVVYQKEIEAAVGEEKEKFMPKEAQYGKKYADSASSKPKKDKLDYSNPPATKKRAQLISYCAPYVVLMALMFAGVFVLYKAVRASVAGDALEAVRHGLSVNQQETLKEFIPDLKGDALNNEAKAISDFVDEKRKNAVANCFSSESSDALRNALKDYPDKTDPKLPMLPPKATKAIIGAAEESTRTLFWNVLGITFLLAGMTVLARILRLAPNPKWFVISVFVFGLGALGYRLCALDDERAYLGRGICAALNWPSINVATWGLIILAAFLALLSLAAEYFFPRWGLRMLLIFGGLGVVGIIAPNIYYATDRGPLWPVVLATAFALYIWQTVALTFDLVFVWQRYVRHWRELGFSKWRPKRA